MKTPPLRSSGFTLVEMLVGLAVSLILVTMTMTVFSHVSSTITNAGRSIDAFQSAEAGFDIMTQKLSDATLNTYYDYDSYTLPKRFLRRSDLHFLVAQNLNLVQSSGTFCGANANSGQSVFFQAPAGYSNSTGPGGYASTQGLLNACSFFVEFGSNCQPSVFSASAPVRYRYRLMQAIQPTEYNGIYGDREGTTPEGPTFAIPINTLPAGWWGASLIAPPSATDAKPAALPIAENVIALIIQPQSPALGGTNAALVSPDYQYNSRQGFPLGANPPLVQVLQSEQLPQILQLTMVAIDEASAVRLQAESATPSSPPTTIENALDPGGVRLFTNPQNYLSDLQSLESSLIASHIRYQILTSTVTLRESKWSSQQ